MAVITKTSMSGQGSRALAITTLGASDTFTYEAGDVMVINNVTVGAITPNLDGDGSTNAALPGYGSDVPVSAGYDVPSIPAGDYAVIPLDTIKLWLKGTVTVTAGDGAEVAIQKA